MISSFEPLNSFFDFFKNYQCPMCKKKFRKIEESMQHEQVIHGTGRSYTCNECKLDFEGMEQMRDHIKRCHSYKKNINNKK